MSNREDPTDNEEVFDASESKITIHGSVGAFNYRPDSHNTSNFETTNVSLPSRQGGDRIITPTLVVAIITLLVMVWLATDPFNVSSAPSATAETSDTSTVNGTELNECPSEIHLPDLPVVAYRGSPFPPKDRLSMPTAHQWEFIVDSNDKSSVALKLSWNLEDPRATRTYVKISGIKGQSNPEDISIVQNHGFDVPIPEKSACGAWQRLVPPVQFGGTFSTVSFAGLSPGTRYCFAFNATDVDGHTTLPAASYASVPNCKPAIPGTSGNFS